MIEVRYFCGRDEGEEVLTVLDCSEASLFLPDDRSSIEKKMLGW